MRKLKFFIAAVLACFLAASAGGAALPAAAAEKEYYLGGMTAGFSLSAGGAQVGGAGPGVHLRRAGLAKEILDREPVGRGRVQNGRALVCGQRQPARRDLGDAAAHPRAHQHAVLGAAGVGAVQVGQADAVFMRRRQRRAVDF